MFRKIFLAILVVTLLMSVASYAQSKTMPHGTIKIGYIGELSGPRAPYGNGELNMLKLAVDDANATGGLLGKKIEIVALDTKGNDQEAVNAVKQLVQNYHVCAIIGTDTSTINIATAPFINTAKVPQIATRATHSRVTIDEHGHPRPYSFRMCFTDEHQSEIAAALALDTLNLDTAAVFSNISSIYADALSHYFVMHYQSKGGRIIDYEKYRSGETNFRSQLTRIKSARPKVLFLPGEGIELAMIIKQARAMNIDAEIISCDSYGAFMNAIAGNAMENSYWINHAYVEDPTMLMLLNRYKQTYGQDKKGIFTTVLAYDAGAMLFDAIKRAGSTDGTAIAKALENTKNLKLVHAVMTIDPSTHNPVKKPGICLKVDKELHARIFKKISHH